MATGNSMPPRGGAKLITKVLLTELRKQVEQSPPSKPLEIRDASLKGFLVRVQPSGVMSYIVQMGRGKRITLGKVNVLTLAQARNKATVALGAVADGRDARAALRVDDGEQVPTLREFVEGQYGDWVKANRKTGAGLVARLRACFFADFGATPLDQLTAWNAEKWRKARLQHGRAVGTINRDLSTLKACLNRAVDWEIIDRHPLARVKPSREDRRGVVRYLSREEERRLRKAMEARDERIKTERDRGNEWRQARDIEPMPSLRGQAFADHLTPLVLLSLNTGLRRGELFGLTWADVDLERASLAVHGAGAKSGQTRHVPLNAEAVATLRGWKGDGEAVGLAFPGKDGRRLDNVRKSWAAVLEDAEIQSFRWHDMRHHFASRLVMAGVDLNTVRELLGHSDIKMTLRYAHLAPEHKAAAVARLVL